MSIKRISNTQESILSDINALHQHRYDLNVAHAQISRDGVFRLVQNGDTRNIHFSELAQQQILSKIRVPSDFYSRCPTGLKDSIFNYFNGVEKKDFFFRMDPGCDPALARQEDPEYLERVRAVLSDGYTSIEDRHLFPAVFEALNAQGSELLAYPSFEFDDRITRLVVDFTDCTGVWQDRTYTAGLMVTNSEVGQSSVWIEPLVRCNDYLFYHRATLQKQGVDCRVVHRGNQAMSRVQNMIGQCKEIAQVGLVQTLEAWQAMMTKEHATQFVKSIDALPSRFQVMLEDEWKDQLELSRMQIAMSILEVAKELPLFQRTVVEQQVGKVIKIFDAYESRMANILEEIE